MDIQYKPFDLLLEKNEDGSWVHVLDASARVATAPFQSPFAPRQLSQFLQLLVEPASLDERRMAAKTAALQEVGSKLFQALFHGPIRTSLLESMNAAFGARARLRIRLRLGDLPEFTRLPWEYLYDPARQEFLSCTNHTPFVRYMDQMHRILPYRFKPPLRVLVVIPNPAGFAPIDLRRKWLTLIDSVDQLGAAGQIIFERLNRPTLLELQRRLRQGEYHIIHLIGHGQFDDQTQEGSMIFEDEHGQPRPISGQHLGRMINDHYALRLAILDACTGVRSSIQNPFMQVAQSAVLRGLPAVVPLQFELSPTASAAFSSTLYRAIADYQPIDAALVEVRNAITQASQSLEWSSPALYMRVPDGVLFEERKE